MSRAKSDQTLREAQVGALKQLLDSATEEVIWQVKKLKTDARLRIDTQEAETELAARIEYLLGAIDKLQQLQGDVRPALPVVMFVEREQAPRDQGLVNVERQPQDVSVLRRLLPTLITRVSRIE